MSSVHRPRRRQPHAHDLPNRYNQNMADQLYLSLWFPDFRLDALPAALSGVMRQLAQLSSTPEGKRVQAATAYPLSFSEAPIYQRLYVTDARAEENRDTSASIIENAVAEATEQLHDDVAYEFEMSWRLWAPDSGPGSTAYNADDDDSLDPSARLDTLWKLEPRTVRIIGFGPEFDASSFEQNGQIRIDFGPDYPWVLDEEEDDGDADEADEEKPPSNLLSFRSAASDESEISDASVYIKRNVESLLAFTLSVEKNCGISSRLLWTESGEPLAEKLIARLQRLN